MRRFAVAPVLAFALVSPARAYDFLGDSYLEAYLPRICCFEPLRDGFVATLCGLYTREWDALNHAYSSDARHREGWEQRESPRPRAEFRLQQGWRWLEPVARSTRCPSPTLGAASHISPPSPAATAEENRRSAPAVGCPEALAYALPVLSQSDAERLRPGLEGDAGGVQQIGGGCVEQGGYLWFGLAFYDSEGSTGVGGIGRFDPRTGRIELRRPRLLRDWSAAALLHDGRSLWLATYRFAEGGDEPAIGVVRYDWARDRLVPEPDAMCGFLAVGMVKLGGALWLASDGGLSRRIARGGWEHFVFRVGERRAIETTTCAEVYELARETADDTYDDELGAYLRRRARAAGAR